MLGQFADLREAWQKRGGVGVFEGGLIPQYTLHNVRTNIYGDLFIRNTHNLNVRSSL